MSEPRNWSEDFNALPMEVRLIGCAQEAKVRIQQLGFEKTRLTRAYNLAVSDIELSIKTNKEWLKRLENGSLE